MKKKISFLLILSVISVYGIAQASWHIMNSPVNEDFVSVCFVDQNYGWILSDQGTLISTSDGGHSWQTASLGDGTFTSVHFSGQDHGYITGYQDSSFIMITKNGGDNWELSAHLKAERLNDVYFHDETTGWVVGIKDGLNYNLYTADGGQTWTPQMDIFVQEAELFSVSFRDGMSGNICGAAGAFFTTNSGGTTGWAMNISIPSLGIDLYSIYNWGMFTGCAVGSDGTALYTTNKWSSYVETTTNTDQILNGVSGDPATNKLWAAGENGTIIYTSSYVLGWIVQATGVTETLTDIDMIDDNDGWAVGDNGTILHYGTGTSIEENIPIDLDVFPNPASSHSVFTYELREPSMVSLVIGNYLGQKVETLVNQNQTQGRHQVSWGTSMLPTGIYYYRFTAGELVTSGKIIVIK